MDVFADDTIRQYQRLDPELQELIARRANVAAARRDMETRKTYHTTQLYQVAVDDLNKAVAARSRFRVITGDLQ